MHPSRNFLLSFVSLGILVITGAMAGCASTRTVSMSSVEPAEITFPTEVRTVLILDRSVYSDRTTGLLEGILTGEVLDQDRTGLQAMIDALRDQLSYSGRFAVRVASETLPGNSLTRAFPPALEWSQVEELLRKNSADLLLSVEIFDSDFVVTRSQRMVKKSITENNQTREIEVPEFQVEGVADLTIGIRLYDPATRTIVDEDLYARTHGWKASGSTIKDALLALIDKADAASHVSRQVGAEYARKIAPMPIRISRTFYGSSKRVAEMATGARHADVGDWRGAVQIWEQGLAHAPGKEAGQLCYNLAIGYEVLEEWETARYWVRRAYVDFGNKDARDYVAELDRRVRREELAAQQMR